MSDPSLKVFGGVVKERVSGRSVLPLEWIERLEYNYDFFFAR